MVFCGFTGFIGFKLIDLKPKINHEFRHMGIDISHHNNVYDWDKLDGKVSFCFIKATQGSKYKDPDFERNWKETKNHGIIRGAYCFFQPNVSAEKQFKNFKKHVKLSKGDLPPVLDVELKECDINEVNKWLKMAEKHYKVKPIVYSGHIF